MTTVPTDYQSAHQPSAGLKDEPVRRSSDWVLLVAIAIIVLATIVALFQPAWALRIALICAIVAACCGAAWWLAAMISRTAGESRSIDTTRPESADDDADSDHPATPTKPAPLAVSELQHPLGLAGLSAQGLRYFQFVATERLWANHRLNLAHTPHHRLIQAQVSPQLWQVLSGQPAAAHYYNQHIPLPQLLQEIENL